MSQGQRFTYPVAAQVAQKYSELISPFCKRVEIVGSVRRHKADVGDIEILCIPMPGIKYDMFGDGADDPDQKNNLLQFNIADLAKRNYLIFQKNGPKYKRILTPEGMSLDIFISQEASWPVELAIRTGPAEFSHKCVMPRSQGGWLPSNCRIHDGWQVFRGSGTVAMNSEREFLAFLGLGWVEPWDRHERLICGESVIPGRVS